jgi:hypothetical protein
LSLAQLKKIQNTASIPHFFLNRRTQIHPKSAGQCADTYELLSKALFDAGRVKKIEII